MSDITLRVSMIFLLVVSTRQDQCSRPVSVSIRSSRNQTGHWHTHILWDHQADTADLDNRETRPLLFNMSQRTRGCSAEQMLSMEATLMLPPPLAKPGYALIPGVGRYKLHTKGVTWEEARQTCVSEGGHLAVIRSKKQGDALTALYARHPKIEGTTWDQVIWLGFHDHDTEGQFITVLGESFADIGYADWDSGQPDNHYYKDLKVDSDCGGLLRKGKICDLPCNAKYAFVCEDPAGY
ncbi:hemolymph lipopolysaccharide-binding protein [Anabrus simplex]|uniref:hemolymph lipopolysaccharide-binding protein n=1 Tax=Anabrus simplex TaxID=316456 RepID=UPI0035A2D6C3